MNNISKPKEVASRALIDREQVYRRSSVELPTFDLCRVDACGVHLKLVDPRTPTNVPRHCRAPHGAVRSFGSGFARAKGPGALLAGATVGGRLVKKIGRLAGVRCRYRDPYSRALVANSQDPRPPRADA